jgi:hypothetical protein
MRRNDNAQPRSIHKHLAHPAALILLNKLGLKGVGAQFAADVLSGRTAKTQDDLWPRGLDNGLVKRPAKMRQGKHFVSEIGLATRSNEYQVACRNVTRIDTKAPEQMQDSRGHAIRSGRSTLPDFVAVGRPVGWQ